MKVPKSNIAQHDNATIAQITMLKKINLIVILKIVQVIQDMFMILIHKVC